MTGSVVAAIKSDALKDLAVAHATIILRREIHLFDPEIGLEENRRINDEGTVRLYETILKFPNGRNYADEWLTNMIREASNDEAALDGGVRAIAAYLIEKAEPLPESLRGWCAETIGSRGNVRQRGKRGPNSSARISRNVVICNAVRGIAEQYGFAKTRNRVTRRVESACSIVAKALEKIGHAMSEENVEKIVERLYAQSRRSRPNN